MRHSASMSLLISPVQSGGKFTDDGTFFKETWLVSMIYFKSVTQGVKDVVISGSDNALVPSWRQDIT